MSSYRSASSIKESLPLENEWLLVKGLEGGRTTGDRLSVLVLGLEAGGCLEAEPSSKSSSSERAQVDRTEFTYSHVGMAWNVKWRGVREQQEQVVEQIPCSLALFDDMLHKYTTCDKKDTSSCTTAIDQSTNLVHVQALFDAYSHLHSSLSF